MEDKIKKQHTFDRRSMSTIFPFTTSEVSHSSGIPLGFNKQTGTPILFDNFHNSLTNYNMGNCFANRISAGNKRVY